MTSAHEDLELSLPKIQGAGDEWAAVSLAGAPHPFRYGFRAHTVCTLYFSF
jgi:hypothetical protein